MTAPEFPATPEVPAEGYESGLVNRRRVLGDAWVDKSLANRNGFNAEFQELITRHAWNDIWGRPALGDKTRRYMVLSMMLGIHAYEEFAMHVRAALDGPPESRLTPEDIKEVIMMAAIYCGVPVANHAFGIATGILREKGLLAAAPAPPARLQVSAPDAPRKGRFDLSFTLLLPLLLAAQPVATDSYLPALPAIAKELGSASTSLTLFVLAFGFAQLLCGPLADRFGRRPVLLAGLGCYIVAALGGALAGSVALLAGWRTLQGFSMAAILVCSRAAVRDLYPAHEGPHVMARGLTGLGVVGLLAPLLGAWLVQGAGWRWVMVAMALYASVLFAMCWHAFGETRRPVAPGSGESSAPRGSTRAVFASRSFRAWASVAATTYGGLFCFLLLSPMVYIGYLGWSPAWYGWIPAGGSLVYIFSTTMCRTLLRRYGPVRTVRLGASLSLAGPVIQALGCLLLPPSAVPLLVGHAVYCLGHGIHQPCGQAGAVGDLPHLAGRAVSWSGFGMMMVAFCVGQLAARFVDNDYSNGAWPMVVPMLCAGCVLMAIAFFWLPRLQHPTKETTP